MLMPLAPPGILTHQPVTGGKRIKLTLRLDFRSLADFGSLSFAAPLPAEAPWLVLMRLPYP
jgi:hypothetical protein